MAAKRKRKNKKQPVIYARCTADEHKVIEVAAGKAGMKIAQWARYILAQQAYAIVPRRERPAAKPKMIRKRAA